MIYVFARTDYKTFELLDTFPSHKFTMSEVGNSYREYLDKDNDYREIIVFKLGGDCKLSIPSTQNIKE